MSTLRASKVVLILTVCIGVLLSCASETFEGEAEHFDALTTAEVRGSITAEFVQGGTFQMGTPSGGSDNERPVRNVTVSSFRMARTPTTFAQYDAFARATNRDLPSDLGFGRGKRPVINVTWYDAVAYANWLSEQDGLTPAYRISGINVTWNRGANGWRLPTEAEWEFAARGGTQSRGYTYAGSNDVNAVAWHGGNSNGRTQPVGEKQANELGLHDMSGNVWEWVWDWDWDGAYPSSAQTEPTGPSSGRFRILRGGSWIRRAEDSRSAARGSASPGNRFFGSGVRLVRPAVLGGAPGTTPAAAIAPAVRPGFQVEQTTGSIRVTVATAGTVYLDGERIGHLRAGQSATLSEVETGNRGVDVRYADGERETRTVAVRSGTATTARFSYVERTVPEGYQIGSRGPAGGIVFYDKGRVSDGWRYLEAAPNDLDHGRRMNWDDAMSAARSFRFGGYSDWRPPTKDELNWMYENLYQKGVGSFASDSYWSSSEVDIYLAWIQLFSLGGQGHGYKSNNDRVRAVRAF